jgi:hypothetical protein
LGEIAPYPLSRFGSRPIHYLADIVKTGARDIVFGEGFAGISDLEIGPDGY